jgi:hypothetical protein
MGPTLQVGAAGTAGAAGAGEAAGAGSAVGAVGAGACALAVKAIARAAAAIISRMRFELIIIGAVPPKVVLCCQSQNEFSLKAFPKRGIQMLLWWSGRFGLTLVTQRLHKYSVRNASGKHEEKLNSFCSRQIQQSIRAGMQR